MGDNVSASCYFAPKNCLEVPNRTVGVWSRPTLAGKLGAGFALPFDGGERGIGPATFGRFLDRGIDLAEPPVKVGESASVSICRRPSATSPSLSAPTQTASAQSDG